MASGTFEKNSIDWQFQKFSQQVGEWFEGLFDRSNIDDFNPQAPTLPEWFFKGLFWLIVGSAVIWVGWQFYQLLRPYFLSYWRLRRGSDRIVVAVSPQRTVADWLKQARGAQQQGNYRAACQALYMATLQQLNDRGMIPQELSRTDGEYLNLLQSLSLPKPYQVLIRTHERLCFDRVTVSSEVYDRCWQAYQEIERS